jgi:hypothetical protein
MRRLDDGAGRGARGRKGTLLPFPSGTGAPPGGTTTPRQELAVRRKCLASAVPVLKNAAMARRKAPRAPKGVRELRKVAPIGAPFPSF